MLSFVAILSWSVNDSVHINGLHPLTTHRFYSYPTITINQPSALSVFHLPFPNAQAVIFSVLCCLGMKTVDLNG